MAAIAAAQHGLKVALLEPGRHVGGMVSGGLSNSDVDRQEALVGGLTREFSEAVGRRVISFQTLLIKRSLKAT